ncbi:MAG: hypothetical protein LBD46_08240 [Endomicrobium sp.]|jgi:tetratricopeptide (TPR) repeat protein|nr:hypothetical protein [Endomicrobium sp.]
MSRSAFNVLLLCALIVIFFCSVYGATKQRKTDIFCIGDSIVLGNRGSSIYSETLQILLDREYGANKVSVYNYSFFDMNTAQCLKLISDILSKSNSNTEFIVIMVGEANYYNLNGFTEYLKGKGIYTAQDAFINENDVDSVKKLNNEVASMYASPAAHSNKASLYYAFCTAYRSIAGSSPKKVDGYAPKIIPSFLVLSEDIVTNIDIGASFDARYKLVWDFINEKKYKEAEMLIKEMLRIKPLDSRLYYTLGSLYLMDAGNSRVNEALKMFEEGILINPFDKTNQCYKGLSVMYMSYDGIIISEILYFTKVMKSYIGEFIPEINSITAINTTDYNIKMRMINEWIISDIKKIDELCKNKNVRLLVADYPLSAKTGEFLRDALSSGGIVFVDNKSVLKNVDVSQETSIYAQTAKNVMEAINKIKK